MKIGKHVQVIEHWSDRALVWKEKQAILPRVNTTRKIFWRHMMQNAPAADRNKDFILKVLQSVLAADVSGQALEIASGTGQHMVHFAPNFKNLIWQPSDIDQSHLQSISAYMEHHRLQNVRTPVHIDITTPAEQWNLDRQFTPGSYCVLYNANMIHIAPWATAVGLFKAAGYLLKPSGFLFTYGPYAHNGVLEPDSNVSFDRSLRSRDPDWGIRDIKDLKKLADDNGIKLLQIVDMPANNKTLIWQKSSS